MTVRSKAIARELFPGGTGRKKQKRDPQEHEILMGVHLGELKVHYFREYLFHERRSWRFDFAVPGQMLAIEIEGGAYEFYNPRTGKKQVGGHVRGDQYYDNCAKYNHAQVLGWAVLRFSVEEVLNGSAKALIARWLEAKARGFTYGI